MNVFFIERGITQAHCAQVVAKNRTHALKNIAAAYPMNLRPEDVESRPTSVIRCGKPRWPRAPMAASLWCSRARAGRSKITRPIWVRGVGFANDSPTLESRDWIDAQYIRSAAAMAYRQAGIEDPASEIDLFEVDDTYAYKELQHLVALGIYFRPAAGRAVESGERGASGKSTAHECFRRIVGDWPHARGKRSLPPRRDCLSAARRSWAAPARESESWHGAILAGRADDQRRRRYCGCGVMG